MISNSMMIIPFDFPLSFLFELANLPSNVVSYTGLMNISARFSVALMYFSERIIFNSGKKIFGNIYNTDSQISDSIFDFRRFEQWNSALVVNPKLWVSKIEVFLRTFLHCNEWNTSFLYWKTKLIASSEVQNNVNRRTYNAVTVMISLFFRLAQMVWSTRDGVLTITTRLNSITTRLK